MLRAMGPLLFVGVVLALAVGAPAEGDRVSVTPAAGVAGHYGTWTVTWTAGADGLRTGGTVRVQLPDTWHAGERNSANRLQATDPQGDHYVSARVSRPEATVWNRPLHAAERGHRARRGGRPRRPAAGARESHAGPPGGPRRAHLLRRSATCGCASAATCAGASSWPGRAPYGSGRSSERPRSRLGPAATGIGGRGRAAVVRSRARRGRCRPGEPRSARRTP